jgi:uroporphyrinogen decarboxylase
MTGRERVLKAIDRQETDRVPKDLGSTNFSSITLNAYSKLLDYLNLTELKEETKIISRYTQVVLPHHRVLERFNIDTRGIFMGPPDGWMDRDLDNDSYEDEWHVVRTKPQTSFYYDLTRSPLTGEISNKDVRNFSWPNPEDPGRTRPLRSQISNLKSENKYARVLNLGIGPVHLTQYLRGFENWYIDIGMNDKTFFYLMETVTDLILRMMGPSLETAGTDVDIVAIGDDLGHQHGLIISPQAYRKFFKPAHAKMFGLIHKKTKAKVLLHSCGAVDGLIPDLIEIGLDILNPVQVRAKDMDPKALKSKYGDQISFWGGIDTQQVLSQGCPQDVQKEVALRITQLGKGGGYVVNSVHNIQPDVSPQNICALFDSVDH